MQYGHFDDARREYVIDRVDLPASWTNYLGTERMCAVVNHTAGGYLFCGSAEYHRITRFRANAVPADGPGHYIYLRDDDTGDYWSVSWQPVGKPLDQAAYRCRHGFSYTVYECEYAGIFAAQTLFIPRGEETEVWDLRLENRSARERHISVFSYAELSFHQIDMDNRNFQMSLYAAGASYADGIIEQDLHYEEDGFQYFAASFADPDSFDAVRERFLGAYRTERNPLGVENGALSGAAAAGGNQCCGLHKRFVLASGSSLRCAFFLGEGRRAEGARIRAALAYPDARDAALAALRGFWKEKCAALQVATPSGAMNTMLNLWTLYQSEINIHFSRFASFIEVGGRTGLGYRDTAQDAMTVLHSNPQDCRMRIGQLLCGLTRQGYGLHLFSPEWFEPQPQQSFKSPTVVPAPGAAEMVHGLADACSDDALWLVFTVVQYVRETGDTDFLRQELRYAEGGSGTVYEHLTRILDFSARMIGAHGICQGLRADWNDCLNLGGGESAMVSFLFIWALDAFAALAGRLGRKGDAEKYTALRRLQTERCESVLWDGEWYLRGFTKSGRPIGTRADAEGRIHLESNAWAVLSGAAPAGRALQAMDAVYDQLFTPWGLELNAPAYTRPDDEIGFVTRVYPGLKENGAVFSHSNPWAWAAECRLGRGDRAMELYDALCPARQNDKVEIRRAEPYSYCQFITGRSHPACGEAHHPFMTGSGGWSYFAATQYILGVRPEFEQLIIDPCIPHAWDGFAVTRRWRGAVYEITVENPEHVCSGVRQIRMNGIPTEKIPPLAPGTRARVQVVLGKGGRRP